MNAAGLWSAFFQYLTNKDKREKINEILEREGTIAMAGETLINISRDEIEQARLTTELKNKLDYQSGMVNAERRGRAEGIHEIARKMREMGETPEKIRLITGLAPEIIETI